ncbi:Histone H3 (Lys4) methyltransferase complex and RNA cleavage factor II complex, subunit SWD2 [Trachipleistophora hominis]|uniref:Histone H3 (Lys4) methyltransferase complex and RNA cleavage factor II complex, subunit SWD2 n=1 Tax=Trachipleistophora hominis TaxID=72359 RepID=L7JVU5_TRAHO|nr:Histone H3 (Lys4) methyltransferase complex and RNA cleavage factor II complex, subunit SWD2 [Trachipleistophora hominis]
MDLSSEIISSFQKSVTITSPAIKDVSFVHTGTALAYTQGDALKIHCPLTNTPLDMIHIPDLKKMAFLFDNTILHTTPTHVKYLSLYDNTYIRTYNCEGVCDVQCRTDDDVFMCVSDRKIEFYDLRSAHPLSFLTVRNCIATLNNSCFAVLINKTLLKVFDVGATAPRLTKEVFNAHKIKLTNDNRYLVLGSTKSVLVLDACTGNELQKIFVDNLVDFDVSESSEYLFMLHDGKVSVNRITKKEMIMSVQVGEQKMIRLNPGYAQFVSAVPNLTFYAAE